MTTSHQWILIIGSAFMICWTILYMLTVDLPLYKCKIQTSQGVITSRAMTKKAIKGWLKMMTVKHHHIEVIEVRHV